MPPPRYLKRLVLSATLLLALPALAGDRPLCVIGNFGIGEIDGRFLIYAGQNTFIDTPFPSPPHGPRWDRAYQLTFLLSLMVTPLALLPRPNRRASVVLS